MGLGEAAEGGATALALLILVGAVVLIPALYVLVRALTGQRRPALVVAGSWCALVVVLFGAPYLSADSRAQRRVESARDDVVAAAGEELGGDGTLSVGVRSSPCPAGRREPVRADGRPAAAWVAYGFGESPEPGVLDRFAAALRQAGFVAATSALAPESDGLRTMSGRKVIGTRGPESVLVVVHDYAPHEFSVEVEDGCLDVPER